jgi:hypothetical protein
VPEHWLAQLRAAMGELLDRSRAKTETDSIYVLEEGHSADSPRLHRVASPQDQHPTFWNFMTDPVMTDLAADVVGPDVKFHHAKLNVKSGKGSRGFSWHQDIPAWPHTDFSPVTIGIYIDGCTDDQGPLTVAEGSHDGPLFSMYDDAGNYVVKIRDRDLGWLTQDKIRRVTGGPGTTLLLNCRAVHGSAPNKAEAARPLLLPVYSSADSFPTRRARSRALTRATSCAGSRRSSRASIRGLSRCRPTGAAATSRCGPTRTRTRRRIELFKCRTSRSLPG